MLAPLSWWNDAFVSLPLALAVAWLVSALYPMDERERAFQIAVIVSSG
jgi:hypothetical protein